MQEGQRVTPRTPDEFNTKLPQLWLPFASDNVKPLSWAGTDATDATTTAGLLWTLLSRNTWKEEDLPSQGNARNKLVLIVKILFRKRILINYTGGKLN